MRDAGGGEKEYRLERSGHSASPASARGAGSWSPARARWGTRLVTPTSPLTTVRAMADGRSLLITDLFGRWVTPTDGRVCRRSPAAAAAPRRCQRGGPERIPA